MRPYVAFSYIADVRIVYLASALKSLRGIDSVWRTRIQAKVLDYAADPASVANLVVRLQGDDRLRLRVGDYRVIFTADGVVLIVEKIGHRREVYRS